MQFCSTSPPNKQTADVSVTQRGDFENRQRGRPEGLTGAERTSRRKGEIVKVKVVWVIRAVSSSDWPVIELSVRAKSLTWFRAATPFFRLYLNKVKSLKTRRRKCKNQPFNS